MATEPRESDDVFDLVNARLDDPQRKTNRVGTDRRHLGSGLYLCAECEEPGERLVAGPLSVQGAPRKPGARFGRRLGQGGRRRPPATRGQEDPDEHQPKPTWRPCWPRPQRLRKRIAATAADYDADRIDGYRYAAKTQAIKAELKVVESQLACARARRSATSSTPPTPAQASSTPRSWCSEPSLPPYARSVCTGVPGARVCSTTTR